MGDKIRRIEMPLKITFEKYGSRWTGYVRNPDKSIVPAASRTDDNWELYPRYERCFLWLLGDATEEPMLVREKDILYKAISFEELSSGWGYVEPSAGDGWEDCGSDPRYFSIDEDGNEVYFI